MARARNIKPGFYKNEDLAECSVWARFIFPGLWMLADREGRLEYRPKRIKAELLPFDSQEIEPLLMELEGKKFIHKYQIDGSWFLQILKFSEHQSPHYSEKPSVINPPPLPEYSEKPQAIKEGSKPSDSLIPDSLIPESLLAWAREKGLEHPSLQAHWDYFRDYLQSNPKVAKRYTDVNAAFRNCVRSDWGNIRKNWKTSPISRPWFLSDWSSIVAKGAEFRLKESDFDSPPQFRSAVLKAAGVTQEMVKQAEAMAK